MARVSSKLQFKLSCFVEYDSVEFSKMVELQQSSESIGSEVHDVTV